MYGDELKATASRSHSIKVPSAQRVASVSDFLTEGFSDDVRWAKAGNQSEWACRQSRTYGQNGVATSFPTRGKLKGQV